MTDLDLPPHDLLAEQAVLGALLLSSDAFNDAVQAISADDFYKPAHAEVFSAATDLFSRGEAVDAVTVMDELKVRKSLERIGGAPYLHTLVQQCPVVNNAGYYAEIVAEQAMLRRLLEAGQRVVQLATQGATGADATAVVENARHIVDKVSTIARGSLSSVDLDTLTEAALESYSNPAPPSLPTGWIDLDHLLTGGLRPGTLTVIAARPGVGKSVLGVNVAMQAASSGEGTLLASLEMTKQEVTDRILARAGRIELSRLIEHKLGQDDWRRLERAATKVNGWPLRICDEANIGLTGIRSLARDLTRTPGGWGLIVVDYLQLMRPADPRAPREQQVASFSRGLKLLAKELEVPVIALAQVNRGPEAGADKRPAVSHLRESGSIEADADTVILLHHNPDKPGELEVIVGKNRHGRQGTISLSWSPNYASADNLGRHLEAVKEPS